MKAFEFLAVCFSLLVVVYSKPQYYPRGAMVVDEGIRTPQRVIYRRPWTGYEFYPRGAMVVGEGIRTPQRNITGRPSTGSEMKPGGAVNVTERIRTPQNNMFALPSSVGDALADMGASLQNWAAGVLRAAGIMSKE